MIEHNKLRTPGRNSRNRPAVSRHQDRIFVFGSDLAGRHVADDALHALREYGAVYGRSVGLHGQSYAIPVRDELGRSLPVLVVSRYVQAFLRFAATHKDLRFLVSRLGCGPQDPRDDELAPLFAHAPSNCLLPGAWSRYLKN